MEILLDDNQAQLLASAERFVKQHGGGVRARAVRGKPDGFERTRLAAAAEAGWLALLVPEQAGGSGLGCTELAIVLEQTGAALLSEPIGALAVAARALADSPSAASERWLAPLMAGTAIVLPALSRDCDPNHPAKTIITATPDGDGWRLTGNACDIPCARAADAFLAECLVDQREHGVTGAGRILAVVAADAPGLSVKAAATVDGSHHASLDLQNVRLTPADIIAGPADGASLVAAAVDRILLGAAAEMLGVMGRAHQIAVDYLKTRKQFGRAIGSFQALQHRAVDNHVEVEIVRSLLFQVAGAMDAGRHDRAHVAALCSRTCEAVLTVTKSAIQLHGAIGFTDEHDIGLYLRRAMVLTALHGTAAAQRSRYARLAAASANDFVC